MVRSLLALFSTVLALLASPPAPGQTGINLSSGFDQDRRVLIADGEADPEYTVSGPADSGIGPRAPRVIPADGFPIPPWLEGSLESRWVGLDGADSIGPAGTYSYRITIRLGPEVNPLKVEMMGEWAAAERGVEVRLNGGLLPAAPAGFEDYTVFPQSVGRGLFLPGDNELAFVVENGSPGPTGLRVEAWVDSIPVPEPLDISTGFNQSSAYTFNDGDLDDDYLITDPSGAVQPAAMVPEDGFPIPPWIRRTSTSRWIGVSGDDSISGPGVYCFLMQVTIETAAQAAAARLVGGWAADDQGTDILVNGRSTGFSTAAGPTALTLFPSGFARGLFQEGENSIEFLVSNRGDQPSPVGLRVDALVVAEPPAEISFVRGDADSSGDLDITDAIAGLAFLFTGGPPPTCLEALDVDDDGHLAITDPILLLSHLFLGGPVPAAPFGSCGPDPTPGDLGCDSFPGCP
jgi:hypothetical protein